MRSRRRRSRGNHISRLTLRGVSTVPDAMYVKLKWVITQSYTDAVAESQVTISMNDLFSPSPSQPGTHQPMGFDQWATFYGRYLCFGSSITALITNHSTTVPINCVLYPSINATQDTIAQAREMPFSKYRIFQQGNAGNSSGTMRHFFTPRKIAGDSHAYQDTTFSGAVTGSPGVIRYWQFLIDSQDETDTYSAIIYFKVTYYVKFFLRTELAIS